MSSLLEVLFGYWMNDHADSRSVNMAWERLEPGFKVSTPEKFSGYLSALEYQAFCGGFSSAIRLMTECFGK